MEFVAMDCLNILRVVWADSLGAKSMTTVVVSRCCRVIVDPGAAAMHPSFPLPPDEKRRLRRKALAEIARAVRDAKLVVITHYHYDHYVRPWDPDYPGPNPYTGRLVVAKNPNIYINESQRARAEELLARLLNEAGVDVQSLLEEPVTPDVPDPEESMVETLRNTSSGRLEAGRRWFKNLVSKWGSWRRFPREIRAGNIHLVLADEGVWECCGVRVKLLGPHFHGDIYERTGWVVPVLIEANGCKILYTSDLMGPLSEDYTSEIIELKPDVIIADGPATYLPPYMFSRRDLERAKTNMKRVVREATPQLIIWDHHLPREPRWREKVNDVIEEAKRNNVKLVTLAEHIGRDKTLVEEAAEKSKHSSP